MYRFARSAIFSFLVVACSAVPALAAQTCVGQWASNGVWRVRVDKVESIVQPDSTTPGYGLTIEVKNQSGVTASLGYTGVGVTTLWLSGDTTLDLGTGAGIAWSKLYYKDIRPATGFTHRLDYYSDDTSVPLGTPIKWTLDIDPKKAGGEAPHYGTATPGISIRLDCPK